MKDAIASPRMIRGVNLRFNKVVKQIALRTLQTMTIMSTCGRISTVHFGSTGCAKQYETRVDSWFLRL